MIVLCVLFAKYCFRQEVIRKSKFKTKLAHFQARFKKIEFRSLTDWEIILNNK